MSEWTDVSDKLPPDLQFPYQVVAACKKVCGPDSCYPGEPVKTIVQDWVVRKWPDQFLSWFVMPPMEGK